MVEYNRDIAKIIENLKVMTETSNSIHSQELDLEYTPTEFPLIKQCQVLIKPFQELWQMFVDAKDSLKLWNDSIISTLDPEFIRVTHKKFMVTA